MKNTIIILILLLASCSKSSFNPNSVDGTWTMYEKGNVVYGRLAKVRYSNGNSYEYLSSVGKWSSDGTYTVQDSIFTFTSSTGSTIRKAIFELSVTGDTLTFRDLNYKTTYPHGGEPKDVFKRSE